jgi:hypothetical protein
MRDIQYLLSLIGPADCLFLLSAKVRALYYTTERGTKLKYRITTLTFMRHIVTYLIH